MHNRGTRQCDSGSGVWETPNIVWPPVNGPHDVYKEALCRYLQSRVGTCAVALSRQAPVVRKWRSAVSLNTFCNNVCVCCQQSIALH
jgi:hypothetical protein